LTLEMRNARPDTAQLIESLITIVSEANAAIMKIRGGDIGVRTKDDNSPVTLADEASDAIIQAGLARLLPDVPVVSEESATTAARPGAGAEFLLVDPLDGTKEFISGNDEFTVNIALLQDGKPMLGVVGAPAQGVIWWGIVGQAAERLELTPGAPASEVRNRRAIRARQWPGDTVVAMVSRSHLDPKSEELLSRLPKVDRAGCGSSVKFCRLAEGTADIYPRLAPTSEWDIAAGHAVLAAAGGSVTAPDGQPLTYGVNPKGFLVPQFLAVGDRAGLRQLGIA